MRHAAWIVCFLAASAIGTAGVARSLILLEVLDTLRARWKDSRDQPKPENSTGIWCERGCECGSMRKKSPEKNTSTVKHAPRVGILHPPLTCPVVGAFRLRSSARDMPRCSPHGTRTRAPRAGAGHACVLPRGGKQRRSQVQRECSSQVESSLNINNH